MKNILLILVGGTICTVLNEKGTLSIKKEAGAVIKENFLKSDSPYAGKVNIDLTENLCVLSENMTTDKWNTIIDTYRSYTGKKHYDGVIFAHGTDTLAYTASLFSMILAETKIPVFFVSSNKRLDADGANGNDNMRCAVECICKGIEPNVYVSYKNISDGQMYLHLASRIEQCKNYSDDFSSSGAIKVNGVSDEFIETVKKQFPSVKRKSFINVFDEWKIKECVLKIVPYVGINYNAFNVEGYSAILHGTYHSGTACAEGENSVQSLADKCRNSDVYLAPSKLTGEIYETVDVMGNHTANGKKINFLYGMTNEMAYCKLLLAYSLFESEKERKEFIGTECNFEIIA